ncbi:MAG TPA: acyltransferase [Rhodocyclaceae bacterium]|jgi:predicted LPLAT superfamily acyltransferase|nr:acyltransferase [Rhodocyclaceae bacterium]
MSAQAHWSRLAERGSGLGLRFVFVCQRLLGRRVTRTLLYPIVLYFFLTAATAREASRSYLRQLKASRRPDLSLGWASSFRHFYAFAASGLDKLVAWSGRLDHDSVIFPQRAAFEALLASGKGAVLIGAHLGNLEMTRALASDRRIAKINAVVYTDHAQRFSRTLEHANANFGANLIQISSLGPDTAILLQEKIDRGELIVIVGDRTPPGDVLREGGRIIEAEFLGRKAPFAVGPWILASLLNCPVYLFFCLPQDDGYCLHFEPFAEKIDLPRKSRQAALDGYVQRYADRLADYCAIAPLQWFNFFDYWKSGRSTATTSS